MQCIAIPQTSAEAPLRRLGNRHRPEIEKHLLALDPVSRNRRFHCGFGDAAVSAYVQKLDLATGVVVAAIESATGQIVGLGEAHPSDVPRTVDIGASVLADHRRRGLGRQLVIQAVAAAIEQGATTVRLSFDPTDPAVRRIVARLGARTCAPGLAVLHIDGSPPHSLARGCPPQHDAPASPKAPVYVLAQ